MSAHNELSIIKRSFSGDAYADVQKRSGEREVGSAIMFDFVAHVQSAEDDIIEAEEEQIRAVAKRRFSKLLKLYLQKILSGEELKFVAVCLRSEETPYKVGVAMGIDYRKAWKSIQSKHAANLDKLQRLMQACGYDFYWHLAFLPKLERYFNNRKECNAHFRAYRAAHREKINAQQRAWHAAHREEFNAKSRAYCAVHREERRAINRAYYAAHREERRAKNRAYCAVHKEERRATKRAYYAAHREEFKARFKDYRAAHREELNAKSRAYYAAHREERIAKTRAWQAAKKAQEKAGT